MSLAVSATQIREGLEALEVHLEDTRPVWRDVVRKDFEENYFEPLRPLVVRALRAVDRMVQVMSQMRQECSE
jgi:hypothetical protein